jgi:hypothetical protein
MDTAVWTVVVVAEASEIVKHYGVASLTGDDCAGEWPVEFSPDVRHCL